MSDLPWWKRKYAYCKIPKALFTEEAYKQLSPLAKLLYAFLLDRTSLSYSSGKNWMAEDGSYFVYYPICEIMLRFSCGRDKASALLKELEEANLITRTLKGRGCPYRITVQSFITCEDLQTTECPEKPHEDVGEAGSNKTDLSKPEIINPNLLTQCDRGEWIAVIRSHICYDVLLDEIPSEQLDGIISIIVDTLSHDGRYIRIFGAQIPKSEVQLRLWNLNDMHIRYVYYRLMKETNDIQNLRGYILARLYEAADVMDSYFAIQVNHDLFNKREEKYR